MHLHETNVVFALRNRQRMKEYLMEYVYFAIYGVYSI